MIQYYSTNNYNTPEGYTCAFREWKKDTVDSQLHGYAFGFSFGFEIVNAEYTFSDMEFICTYLSTLFGHTTIVASDDPCLPLFTKLEERGACTLRVLPQVTFKDLAKTVFDDVQAMLQHDTKENVKLVFVSIKPQSKKSVSYPDNVPETILPNNA